ncbi:MAG: autotransporter domain-containing protein [Planctomycetia bacterium]|nr:autotransporter domain-containing protein [Planctomycetia bacterium]
MSITKSRYFSHVFQLLFGSLLTGAFLFQGTGYITEAFGQTTENNVNVEISDTGATDVSATTYYTGLTGPGGSSTAATTGTISITDGATAVVGILDTTVKTLNDIDPVRLTVTSTGSGSGLVTIGTEDSTAAKTILVVAGDSNSASSLIMGNISDATNGTNLTIWDGGMLQIGLDAESEDVGNGLGTVTIANGSQLFNAGNHTATVDYGLLVSANGTLQIGNSADDLSSGALLTGDGLTTNNGTITIYNNTGDDNKAYFGIYADKSGAKLDATGTVHLFSGTHATSSVEDGGVTVNGAIGTVTTPDNLILSNSLYIAATGTVSVKDLTLEQTASTVSNAGYLKVTGDITTGAATTEFTNTGRAIIETLDLASGVSYVNNTTKDSTTLYSSLVNLTVSGGSFENKLGTATIGTLNLSAGTATTSGGATAITTANLTGGTLSMSAGTTTVATATQSDGAISLATGGTMTLTNWTLSGGSASVAAGTLTTSGTLDMTGGTLTTSGGATTLNNVNLSSGSIATSAGTTKITNLMQSGGTITSTGGTTSLSGMSTAGSVDVSAGTVSLVDFAADSLDPATAWLNITADGIVKVTGDYDALDGSVNINASDTDIAAFDLVEGGDLGIDFADNTNPILNLTQGQVNFQEDSTISAFNAGSLSGGTYTRTLVAKNGENAEDMVIHFNSDLGQDSAFFKMAYDETDTAANISLTVADFADFALSDNQRAVAANLDNLRTGDNITEPLRDLIEDEIMYTAATAGDVRDAMQKLAATGKANSFMLAMDSCWNFAFNQLDYAKHKTRTQASSPDYSQYRYYRGQAVDEYYTDEYSDESSWSDMTLGSVFAGNGRTPHNAWATFYSTALKGLDDDNSDPYNITRTGGAFGYDADYSNGARGGLMFSYSQPFLRSDNHHIDASNFQLALYCEKDYCNDLNLKVFVAGGTQEYTSKRSITLGQYSDYFRTTYNGNSLSAAARLSKEYMVNCNSLLRPYIQFDSQTVWQDACSEGAGAAALSYEKGDWTRAFGRVGLEAEVDAEFLQIIGRAAYAIQMNDQTAPESVAQFTNVLNPNSNMTLLGVDTGQNFVNLGLGALGYLDCSRNWTLSGNYDFVGAENLRAHTGSVSVMYLF